MSTYAIGDVQGCYDELRALLKKIRFNPNKDRLWFTGDLVSRGPQSLATLRFVKQLGKAAVVTLGNHDLHLLAFHAHPGIRRKPDPTLVQVLAAPDCTELMDWLRRRPLLHHDPALGFTLVHAGLPAPWSLTQARRCAREVQQQLRGPRYRRLLRQMYGNEPKRWSPGLRGSQRLRFIINSFTRMRYCHADGALALDSKGPLGTQPADCLPWFALPGRRSAGGKIVFGHWSALGQVRWPEHGVYGVDSGCVWGGALTALRLEDLKTFSLPCPTHQSVGD
ncbi:MAG: symmetrical bis(5'-nucleosyl)-tetraphosphatase [Nevskiales bacterium]